MMEKEVNNKQKVKYFYRITDKIFILYKVSAKTHPCVKEINVCLAYNDQEELSKKAKKLIEKYNLEKNEGIERSANSHLDFCTRLYLRTFPSTNKNPLIFGTKVMNSLKHFYERYKNGE